MGCYAQAEPKFGYKLRVEHGVSTEIGKPYRWI